MDNETLLDFVRSELDSRKGTWPAIAKVMEPDPELCGGYYSWLTKFARGKIHDPGINKVQALADYFRGIQREAA